MLLNVKNQTDLSGFYVIYEGSTNIEYPGVYGISHLMEHLVCKSFDHLLEDFDKDGISWNAYTETNLINFHFTGLESRLSKYREEILKSLSTFTVTEEQFENERNIVLSEYGDYFNMQTYAHVLNLHRKLFNVYDPIGLRSDIETLTYQDCLDCFERQYKYPSKIINVSKTYEMNEDDYTFMYPDIKRNVEIGDHDVPFELGNTFKDKTSLILTNVVQESPAVVNYINQMLSMGLKSPFYQEIREKRGLVYYVAVYQSRIHETGVNTISTLTANENVEELIDTVKELLSNPDKYFTRERYDLVREWLTAKKEKEEILRHSNIGKFITPEGWSIYDALDVSFEEMREIYDKNYKFESFHISNDKTEFLQPVEEAVV